MTQVKAIHRFWGGRDMPDEYEAYGCKWRELHPGWLVTDWSLEDVLPHMPNGLASIVSDLYYRDNGRHGVELYVQIADVVGYYLVEKFGGVYVNCDIEPLKNIELILPDKAWASYENHEDGRIVNAVIGAPEAHDPFWVKILDGLADNYFADRTAEMVMSTGPGYLTRIANENRAMIEVLPVEAFNPIHWKQIAAGGDATGFEYPEESYGVHHWGHKKDGRSNHIETATPMPEEN